MKRWTARVWFVAPACGLTAVGLSVGVTGTHAPSERTAVTTVGDALPPSGAATVLPFPPPHITAIVVPTSIADAARTAGARGSVDQVISVVVLRADPGNCLPQGYTGDPNCRH